MKNTSLIILSCFSLLMSCDNAVEEKELKENFAFQTSLRPGNNKLEELTNTMNEALTSSAKESGKDSVLQARSAQEDDRPPYRDIAFLPILTAAELNTIIEDYTEKRFRANKEDHSAQVSSIDFDKNFVFIVSHPKASSDVFSEANNSNGVYYMDRVLDDGIENNNLRIILQSKRLGDVAMASFKQKWESNVYVIEKKNADSLLVEIDSNVYPFSLKTMP